MVQFWPTDVYLAPPEDSLAAPEANVQRLVWAVAGVFVAASVLSSALLIRGHLNHFTQPIVQSKIVGILWMVPIYATDSWLSLRFKDAALYLDLMRDSYEGYVIYLFLALMIAYLGGGNNERVIASMRGLPDLNHPWPFKRWLKPIQMGPGFLRDCKMATMQFVVVKPMMAFVAIVLRLNGMYDQGNFSAKKGYLYTSLLVNASITYAFYYLVLFYLALRAQLAPYNPVPKFLCIKAVLFLSFWQSVVLAFLSRFQIIHELGSWSVENVTTGIQNLLICFEMFFVALAHHKAFPYQPYVHGNPALRTSILADHLAFEDAMRDFNEVMPVVLPTPFKPGAATLKAKKKYDLVHPKDLFDSETVRLLSDDGATSDAESESSLDSRTSRSSRSSGTGGKAVSRGWKL
ncbi:Transmembrane protein 184 [Phytophthora citrophthora]|uniref:Transmembrane protein 184 n=1 Tax=Phytophthora citrophthora TaxID=4793 RepID=A0AAD9GVS9_9STRA|nr:Transmembrane protein 184 [Phytophthora citrophthora]